MDARATPRLFLVEDDIRTAKVLARLLVEDGFDVETARDGAAAIARLARPPVPSLLLLDLHLPYAGGIAVARYARSLDPVLPLILTTGYPEHAARAEREMIPRPVVVVKPFVYPELRAQIQVLLPGALGAPVSGGIRGWPREEPYPLR